MTRDEMLCTIVASPPRTCLMAAAAGQALSRALIEAPKSGRGRENPSSVRQEAQIGLSLLSSGAAQEST